MYVACAKIGIAYSGTLILKTRHFASVNLPEQLTQDIYKVFLFWSLIINKTRVKLRMQVDNEMVNGDIARNSEVRRKNLHLSNYHTRFLIDLLLHSRT